MPDANYAIDQALSLFDISLEPVVTGNLVNDSREIQPGDIFCAILGTHQDGRQHIEKAVLAGAKLVIAQCQHHLQHGNIIKRTFGDKSVNLVQFYQLDSRLYDLAKAYYREPQAQMTIVGITGTNGKTSTSQIIAKLLSAYRQDCAIIGTVGAGALDALTPIANTTPGPTQLHQLLAEFSGLGISDVAMEVSSHALTQNRVCPSLLDIAVFTNLSRDHLDYHETMENYAEAKFSIFTGEAGQIAILNGDDRWAGEKLADWPQAQPVIVFGRSEQVKSNRQYLYASNIRATGEGTSFTLDTHLGRFEINSPLMGDFNVDNLLAAIAVLVAKDLPLAQLRAAVETITPILGRMENISVPGKATAVVDYAHTPDALEKALLACRRHCQGQLWLVFGCGGDRDKGKRPQMGKIAEQLSDHVVITNDNPRFEAAELIVSDILAGCEKTEKMTVILDRTQAVLSALSRAKAGDMVLLAGKGHEDYIIIKDEKIEYNERELVLNYFASANEGCKHSQKAGQSESRS
ncbi:UDP-N-acetylmuramoyl-L-alanyl-D-glutamate--2,6-diaminopimelate ligase [Thalassomonas haliotis]|uniref:UDP-N-acetylmuramoyl-L-alanyl-D-glutamate--2,6-diaminopimelate ligase n=1 Tax=Thalassomonas haliotis TaxID=485448 RepID=A0ABY7VED0_9GAMM|nr:UDP-N-acetylmuramoyl-L-alanyl-D-glutamate--2,6-diaminopimelate ligase [Thalassomonas haliotis]WDE11247.1 UDP-N-acetylmuramoyl-L-alanyl-D-glutamate--2,6-diaminopimelate ligase [Thalassomonas haliotis]